MSALRAGKEPTRWATCWRSQGIEPTTLSVIALIPVGLFGLIIGLAYHQNRPPRLGKMPPLPRQDLRAARAKYADADAVIRRRASFLSTCESLPMAATSKGWMSAFGLVEVFELKSVFGLQSRWM